MSSLTKLERVRVKQCRTHGAPIVNKEEKYLRSDEFRAILQRVEIGGYVLV